MSELALFTGGTLTAAATDAPEPRTAEGILVPYGRPGRTSLGLKKIARGALRLVADAAVIGLNGHDRDQPVSRLIASEDRPEGLWGRLRIAQTPAGDHLLAEIRDGVRDGLSVELSDLMFDPADPDLVTSARLDAVAHVPLPAYDTARVSALAASLNDPTGVPALTETAPAEQTADPTMAALLAEMQAMRASMTAAAAPAGLTPGGALTAAPADPAVPADAVAELATMQAAQAAGDTSMLAALADITNSQLPIFQRPAGAIGAQLWQNHSFTRRFVPLLNAKPLNSYKVTGWEFGTGPEVDDWAGDKTEIPTNDIGNPVEIETTAKRIAGGWDIDRKYRDFGDAQFWAWFYAQQTESYARKSDAKARAALLAAAVDITTGATIARYTRPTGYTPVAQADVLRAVAYGTAYLEDTPLVEKAPDYILMNTQDWLGLLDLTNLDLPTFLSLLNVQPGMFQRSNEVPAGSVILGVKQAVDWYELPGAAPIRVEALDVARGGVDSAVFGYWATLNVRPGGIISVPLAAAAG